MSIKINIPVILFFTAALGAFIGYQFGQNEHLKFYKLLNLFGLIYDFIAVLLLSYAVLAKDKIQDAVAHYVSVLFIWFTSMFPACFHIAYQLTGNGSGLDPYMKIFMFISIIPMLYVYCSPVLEPLSYKAYDPSTRIKILGTLLLLVGFAFQITAAVEDLGS